MASFGSKTAASHSLNKSQKMNSKIGFFDNFAEFSPSQNKRIIVSKKIPFLDAPEEMIQRSQYPYTYSQYYYYYQQQASINQAKKKMEEKRTFKQVVKNITDVYKSVVMPKSQPKQDDFGQQKNQANFCQEALKNFKANPFYNQQWLQAPSNAAMSDKNFSNSQSRVNYSMNKNQSSFHTKNRSASSNSHKYQENRHADQTSQSSVLNGGKTVTSNSGYHTFPTMVATKKKVLGKVKQPLSKFSMMTSLTTITSTTTTSTANEKIVKVNSLIEKRRETLQGMSLGKGKSQALNNKNERKALLKKNPLKKKDASDIQGSHEKHINANEYKYSNGFFHGNRELRLYQHPKCNQYRQIQNYCCPQLSQKEGSLSYSLKNCQKCSLKDPCLDEETFLQEIEKKYCEYQPDEEDFQQEGQQEDGGDLSEKPCLWRYAAGSSETAVISNHEIKIEDIDEHEEENSSGSESNCENTFPRKKKDLDPFCFAHPVCAEEHENHEENFQKSCKKSINSLYSSINNIKETIKLLNNLKAKSLKLTCQTKNSKEIIENNAENVKDLEENKEIYFEECKTSNSDNPNSKSCNLKMNFLFNEETVQNKKLNNEEEVKKTVSKQTYKTLLNNYLDRSKSIRDSSQYIAENLSQTNKSCAYPKDSNKLPEISFHPPVTLSSNNIPPTKSFPSLQNITSGKTPVLHHHVFNIKHNDLKKIKSSNNSIRVEASKSCKRIISSKPNRSNNNIFSSSNKSKTSLHRLNKTSHKSSQDISKDLAHLKSSLRHTLNKQFHNPSQVSVTERKFLKKGFHPDYEKCRCRNFQRSDFSKSINPSNFLKGSFIRRTVNSSETSSRHSFHPNSLNDDVRNVSAQTSRLAIGSENEGDSVPLKNLDSTMHRIEKASLSTSSELLKHIQEIIYNLKYQEHSKI